MNEDIQFRHSVASKATNISSGLVGLRGRRRSLSLLMVRNYMGRTESQRLSAREETKPRVFAHEAGDNAANQIDLRVECLSTNL